MSAYFSKALEITRINALRVGFIAAAPAMFALRIAVWTSMQVVRIATTAVFVLIAMSAWPVYSSIKNTARAAVFAVHFMGRRPVFA
jgi:hypothetical protein